MDGEMVAQVRVLLESGFYARFDQLRYCRPLSYGAVSPTEFARQSSGSYTQACFLGELPAGAAQRIAVVRHVCREINGRVRDRDDAADNGTHSYPAGDGRGYGIGCRQNAQRYAQFSSQAGSDHRASAQCCPAGPFKPRLACDFLS